MRPTSNPWTTCYRSSRPARVRLFCFPYAGGSASIFRAWSSGLAPEIELCAVHLPGRERRMMEPPFTRLAPMVETLAQSLEPQMDLPFAFFGHSMGALISFELARRLRLEGQRGPDHLFVSGHRAPQLPPPRPPIYQLPEQEFVEELRRFEGTPEEILQNVELLQLLIPALRADFEVVGTYSHAAEAPLDCPISVFGGREDSEVSEEELENWRDQTNS